MTGKWKHEGKEKGWKSEGGAGGHEAEIRKETKTHRYQFFKN